MTRNEAADKLTNAALALNRLLADQPDKLWAKLAEETVCPIFEVVDELRQQESADDSHSS